MSISPNSLCFGCEFEEIYRLLKIVSVLLVIVILTLAVASLTECFILSFQMCSEKNGAGINTVLEHSHTSYLKIRELLKNKQDVSAISFYNLLENGLDSKGDNRGFCIACLGLF